MKLKLKRISIFLLTLVLFITNPSFTTSVIAASSPWTQSDWSGGSGQTNWSDTTKFNSSTSAVTTSTPNQATLTSTEKLSNTGFETDLTGWTQTAETAAGTFSDANFLADSTAVASWPLDDTTTTQSYARVVNPAVSTGRDIVINGTLDSSSNWLLGAGWTISGGVASSDGTQAILTYLQQNPAPVTIGKAYQVTFTVVSISGGGFTPRVGSLGIGTTRTTPGTYTETIIAASTTEVRIGAGPTTVGSVDNFIVKEINLPASTATPTQLLTDGDMETSGTAAWTAVNSATLSKQTGTPHGGSQVLRIASGGVANAQANQALLTVGSVYRISGYMRSDGNSTPSIQSAVSISGTTSTSWQPFDTVFVAGTTTIALRGSSAVNGQYVEFDDVVVSADNFIRSDSILSTLDGDMEQSGTNYWTASNNATLSKQTANPHGGSQVLRVAYNGSPLAQTTQIVFVTGKTYHITGFARSDGTNVPSVNGTTQLFTGTSSTSWQSFDITYVAGDTVLRLRNGTSSAGYVEFDDVSVTELDPLIGLPTNGVTLGSTAGGHLTNAYSFDGSNDLVNIYSSDLNSAFNPSEGTIVAWAKVANSGVWSDGINRTLTVMLADTNNRLIIGKRGSGNVIFGGMTSGGVVKANISTFTSSTDWFQVAMTWSKSSDEQIMYVNGIQNGTTQTGLGTWVGNLSSASPSQTNIGGTSSTFGYSPWSGLINDVRLYNTALSPTQIANLYNGFTTTRDTGTKYAGTASMKTVAEGHSNVDIIQSVNVGDTESYYLSAYAYTDGSAVTSSDVELFYNGATVSTTYTSAGAGWYQLTGTVTGANASRNYGVQTKSGKTVYIDNLSLKAQSGTLTSSIFDTENSGVGSDFGTLTYSATTPSNTSVSVKVRTSDNSSMSGAPDFSTCNLLSSGSSAQTSSCVTNGQKYVQYQIILSNTDGLSSPTFNSISLIFSPHVVSVSAPTCTDTAPSSAPVITSVTAIDQYTLRVTFTKAGSPVSYYAIKYGDSSGNYKWGNPSFGDASTTSYNIGLLTPNTTYYLTVRAGNGCATGPWSSEASGTTKATSITTTVPTGIVPPTPSVPTPPQPTPTTGPGPLPPEKPGGITFPTIDTKPISDFIKNNLNALSSFWETFWKNSQQGLIALQEYINSLKQKGSSLIASIFVRTGNIAYQTSNFLRTAEQVTYKGTQIYTKDLETSLNLATGNREDIGYYISNTLNRSSYDLENFISRSQIALTALSQSIFNTISGTATTIANSIQRFVANVAIAINNSSKMLATFVRQASSNIVATIVNTAKTIANSVSNQVALVSNFTTKAVTTSLDTTNKELNKVASTVEKATSYIATTTNHTAKTFASSVSNQIGLISNSVTKIVTTFLDATNKGLGKLASTINAQFALVSGATNKALIRVQTFLAITSEYWFNSEPTKILSVNVASISPTSAIITWQTNQYASSAVNYGFDTSYGQRAQSDQLVKDHKIEITNLEPNKTYFFEVMSQGKTYVYDSYYTFQTAGSQNQLLKKTKVEIIGNKNDWILVRNAPTKEGGVIAKVQVGQTFQLLMEKNNWFLIKLDGSEGWISKEFGKLIQ